METVEIIKARIKSIDEQITELKKQRENLYHELDEELGLK